jgi:hypothetical protein
MIIKQQYSRTAALQKKILESSHDFVCGVPSLKGA